MVEVLEQISQLESIGHVDEIAPLQHMFVDGVYLRDMFLPAGSKIIGKIHKCEHIAILLSGIINITTESGNVEVLTAPCYFKSSGGTQRMGIAVTDVVFLNIHANPTNTQDLDEIENNVIAKSWDEYYNFELETKKQELITH